MRRAARDRRRGTAAAGPDRFLARARLPPLTARARTATASASASAPSVEGRSPTTTPCEPKRRRTRSTVGAYGLPAISGCAPAAVATRGDERARAGNETARDRVRRVDIRRDEPRPARTASDASRRRSKSNSRCQPTTTASAGLRSTIVNPAASIASTTPGPAHGRTRAPPGARPRAAAPRPARCCRDRPARHRAHPPELSDVVGDTTARVVRQERDAQTARGELRDRTYRTRNRLVTAPDDTVEIATDDHDAGIPPPASPIASDSDACEASASAWAIVVVLRAHDGGQPQVTARASCVTGSQLADAEPVMRVVVDGVDLDRGSELLFRRREAARSEVRGASASRTDPCAGSSSRARSSAITAACALSPASRRVPSGMRGTPRGRRGSARPFPSSNGSERLSIAVVQPTDIPDSGAPVARIPALCRCPLRLRCDRCGPRSARRSTIRRDRRRRARRASKPRIPGTPCGSSCRETRPSRRSLLPRRRSIRRLATRRRPAARPRTALLRIRHGVPRQSWRRAPHPRRDRRAPAARVRNDRRRRVAARTHASEGEVRSACAVAGDACERRPDLGPHPRRGPDGPARRRRRHSANVPTTRRSATNSAPSTTRRRSRRCGASSAVRHWYSRTGTIASRPRRVPRRAPRGRPPGSGRRSDHVLRRRAGRRRMLDRAHPSPRRPSRRRRHPGRSRTRSRSSTRAR